MNWTRVVAIANPHQIVRATLGLVKSVKDRSLNIAVYSDVPSETNWDRRVKGSQGKELKPRFKHVTDEVERIFNYQDKGDLAGFQELFDYLDRRDGVRN